MVVRCQVWSIHSYATEFFMCFLQVNLVYNVPCAGVVRAKTHCDILQLSKSDTSHVLHHFPDSNATPSSSYSCMLPLFSTPLTTSYLFRLHSSINIYFPSPSHSHTLPFSSSLSSSSSNFPVNYLNFHLPPSFLVFVSVANKMKEGIKDRCDAAFNKTVSGSCGLDQQFSSVIRLEEDSGPHTSMMQDTRTRKSDIQRSTGRVQR